MRCMRWARCRLQMRGMGSITTLIPAAPDDPKALLDAAIAFLTPLFRECPSLAAAEAELRGITMLDFHLGKIPESWKALRKSTAMGMSTRALR